MCGKAVLFRKGNPELRLRRPDLAAALHWKKQSFSAHRTVEAGSDNKMAGLEIAISDIKFEAADLTTLKQLLGIFGNAFGEVETYQAAVPSDNYLEALLSSDNFIPLVATVDGCVVGGLAAYILKKFEQERSEIYIYDLAVLEKFRRQGIATGLINKLREIARDLGSYVIFVQADVGDDPAIKLYESLGIREDVHHFDILP